MILDYPFLDTIKRLMLMLQLVNEGGLCEDTTDEVCIFQPCKNNCKGGIGAEL